MRTLLVRLLAAEAVGVSAGLVFSAAPPHGVARAGADGPAPCSTGAPPFPFAGFWATFAGLNTFYGTYGPGFLGLRVSALLDARCRWLEGPPLQTKANATDAASLYRTGFDTGGTGACRVLARRTGVSEVAPAAGTQKPASAGEHGLTPVVDQDPGWHNVSRVPPWAP